MDSILMDAIPTNACLGCVRVRVIFVGIPYWTVFVFPQNWTENIRLNSVHQNSDHRNTDTEPRTAVNSGVFNFVECLYFVKNLPKKELITIDVSSFCDAEEVSELLITSWPLIAIKEKNWFNTQLMAIFHCHTLKTAKIIIKMILQLLFLSAHCRRALFRL